MGDLIWSPGSALPPSVYYAYRNSAGARDSMVPATGCTGSLSVGSCCGGIGKIASAACGSGVNMFCTGTNPDYFMGHGYYHPSGVRFGRTEFSTGPTSCTPVRTCLDPQAINYDAFGNQHCQSLCAYKKPKVCIENHVVHEEPVACTTPSLSAIYSGRTGSRSGGIKEDLF
jgi:hypothetical protein